MNQSELEANTCRPCQARENASPILSDMAAIQSKEETRGNENCNSLERSADSPAQTSITPARREHRYKNLLHLWEFLLELLADENCRSIICWRRKEHGEFRIMNQHEVARRWGMLKQRGGMNYGKLSRALRLYYREGIITKVKGQRLVYKFNNLPYKYEPGITRSFYRERFQTKTANVGEQNLPSPKPLLRMPQIFSTSPLLNSRSALPVVPMPSPQVCWCMDPAPCLSSMCCSTSRIFFPVSSLSASRGFIPAFSDEANSRSSGKPVPVSVIMRAATYTRFCAEDWINNLELN